MKKSTLILSMILSSFGLIACSMSLIPALDAAQDQSTGPGTSTFCQANDDRCTMPQSLPAGFTIDPGTTISIPVSGKPPVTIQLSQAVTVPGSGMLCCGVVATAGSNVKLYRAWAPQYDTNSAEPEGYAASFQFGNWWSADQPDKGSHQTYRLDEDICTAWNSLTVYSECTIVPGTQVFIGPGQSAKCKDGSLLPESPTLQIYVPNFVDRDNGKRHADTKSQFNNCQTFVWPN